MTSFTVALQSNLLIFPHLRHRPSNQPYHVAIYGAGPAGITLARALSGAGLRTGLFEGGLHPSPIGPEHPYRGQNLGRLYDLAATRLRYFGGTSNHWGGWCRPLDPSDFRDRPHIPLNGWPVSHKALAPYLSAATEVCEVPTGGLGLAAFDHDFGDDDFLHHANQNLLAKNFLFSPPTRFGVRYRKDIEEAQDIECFLDATLTHLSSANGAVQEALVRSSDGSEHRVLANRHVLAMGAIENARILLHTGLANRSGLVGRCFGDHLGFTVGTALLPFGSLYLIHKVNYGDQPIKVLPHLSLSGDKQAELGLGNFGILIYMPDRRRLDATGQRVKGQLDALAQANHRSFRILARMECTPNPDSRVTLSNATNAYGVPRVALNWQPHPFDFESLKRLCAYLPPVIGQAGGRVKIEYGRTVGRTLAGSYQAHHLGTTRMSSDPSDGVVNANLRCHDVENLYVAGSSIFPTSGFANPTLTLVALSLRLVGTYAASSVRSMFDLTRRQFLLAAGCTAVATAGIVPAWAKPDFQLNARLATLMAAGHFSPCLGETVMLQQGWAAQADISILHAEVMSNLREDKPDLLTQMHQQIQQDFASGDLCAVDGWHLSRTECRLAALAYLFHQAGGRIGTPRSKGPLEGLRETILACVERWGPKTVEVGKAFNVQPNGNSALWFKLTLHRQGAYVIYVGPEAARTTISAPRNTASAALSQRQVASLWSQAGSLPVHLVDQVRGEKQLIGTIRVLSKSRSAETDETR